MSAIDPKEMREDLSLQYPQVFRREAHALRALEQGNASPDEQVMAYRLIMNKLCLVDNTAFVPGSPDRTAFMAGRAFPAQLAKMILNKDIAKFPESKQGDDR
jgi:hypothetical protein